MEVNVNGRFQGGNIVFPSDLLCFDLVTRGCVLMVSVGVAAGGVVVGPGAGLLLLRLGLVLVPQKVPSEGS